MNEELYNDGKWRIVEETATLPDGRTTTAVRGYRSDTVYILPLHKGNVLLLREYRPFDKQWIWMLPSGHADKETDVLEAAKRELREETGYRAQQIAHYCTAQHSETFGSMCHFFIAEDLVKDPLPQDADEMIEVHELPMEECLTKVLSCGEHQRMTSAFLLLRYMREHQKGE